MDLETQYLGVVTVAQILSNNFLGKTGNRLTFEVFLIHWICRFAVSPWNFSWQQALGPK